MEESDQIRLGFDFSQRLACRRKKIQNQDVLGAQATAKLYTIRVKYAIITAYCDHMATHSPRPNNKLHKAAIFLTERAQSGSCMVDTDKV